MDREMGVSSESSPSEHWAGEKGTCSARRLRSTSLKNALKGISLKGALKSVSFKTANFRGETLKARVSPEPTKPESISRWWESRSFTRRDDDRTIRSVRDLTDGSIKAEALKGGRVVADFTPKEKAFRWWRLEKGSWLELVKDSDGEGRLRLRDPSREDVLMSVPLTVLERMGAPTYFKDKLEGCSLKPRKWRWCGLNFGRTRIFEVEGMVRGARVHAAFEVTDPEAWIAAVGSDEWKN